MLIIVTCINRVVTKNSTGNLRLVSRYICLTYAKLYYYSYPVIALPVVKCLANPKSALAAYWLLQTTEWNSPGCLAQLCRLEMPLLILGKYYISWKYHFSSRGNFYFHWHFRVKYILHVTTHNPRVYKWSYNWAVSYINDFLLVKFLLVTSFFDAFSTILWLIVMETRKQRNENMTTLHSKPLFLSIKICKTVSLWHILHDGSSES